jgi:hypothetical protein
VVTEGLRGGPGRAPAHPAVREHAVTDSVIASLADTKDCRLQEVLASRTAAQGEGLAAVRRDRMQPACGFRISSAGVWQHPGSTRRAPAATPA